MSWWRVGQVAGLLVATTVVLHVLSHGERVPLHRPLDSFPVIVDAWRGQDLQVDPRVIDVLKADDLLIRVYETPSRPPVGLYIAYFRSQRQGDTIHSPKNCLPGAGWQPVQSGRVEVPVGEDQRLLVNRYLVAKGTERDLVYYWYQAHGRVIASEYRAKFYLILDAIKLNRTDGALVRLTLPLGSDEAAGDNVARKFIACIYPLLKLYIPE